MNPNVAPYVNFLITRSTYLQYFKCFQPKKINAALMTHFANFCDNYV